MAPCPKPSLANGGNDMKDIELDDEQVTTQEKVVATANEIDNVDSNKPAIEFDVRNGSNPASDFGWIYYLCKWVVPLIQLATWTCLLVLPFIDYTTRLVWLSVVCSVQLMYTIVGFSQSRNAWLGMKRVQEKSRFYSQVITKNNSNDDGSDTKGSAEGTILVEEHSLSSSDDGTSKDEKKRPVLPPQMSHVFIIPNYNEPESMLADTLEVLSTHPLSATYTVDLAMEAAEDDHESKAERLIEQFKDKFHRIFFTSHVLDKGFEGRVKAANFSFATRHVSKEVELYPQYYCSAICTHTAACSKDDPESAVQNNHHHHCCDRCLEDFSSEKVMVHVLDADAHVHGAYALEIEAVCRRMTEEKNANKNAANDAAADAPPPPGSLTRSIFSAPVIMSRNVLETPWLTRMHDTAWSAAAFQNLTSYSKIGFPISNYSFSLKLVEDTGFLDTNHEAITDDMHFFLKTFYKTNGACRLVPIYVPHNMLNLNTNGGWFHTVHARFVQAERHARGVNEFAYALRQTIANPWGFAKLIALWQTFVAATFPPVIPFFMAVAAPFCQLLYWVHGYFTEAPLYFLLMWTQAFGLMTAVIIGCQLFAHDGATRAANTHLYNKPNMSMYETLCPLPLTFFCLWIYVVGPFALASVRSVLPDCIAKKGGFVVATKQT